MRSSITSLTGSLALGGLLLAGCALPTSNATPQAIGGSGPTNCPPANQLTPSPGTIKNSTPTVVLLTTPGLAPAPADLQTLLTGAQREQANTYVGGLGATTPPSTHAVLKAEGDNDTDRTDNLACKTQLVQAAITTVTNTKTAPNAFTALLNVGATLTGIASKQTDVVLDGPLTSTTPVDLTTVTPTRTTATINKIVAAGLLPPCRGWRITVIAPVSPSLRDFYNQLFNHCGGTLVDWTPALTTFPVTTGRLSLADYTEIPVEHLPGRIVATLAGDVTFATGTADLQPAAAGELQQVRALIPEGSSSVVVDGYTDNTGSDAINGPLSTARARAVAAWLEQHGVGQDRLTPNGHGSTDPAKPNTSDANRQANRRVTITISTVKS